MAKKVIKQNPKIDIDLIDKLAKKKMTLKLSLERFTSYFQRDLNEGIKSSLKEFAHHNKSFEKNDIVNFIENRKGMYLWTKNPIDKQIIKKQYIKILNEIDNETNRMIPIFLANETMDKVYEEIFNNDSMIGIGIINKRHRF